MSRKQITLEFTLGRWGPALVLVCALALLAQSVRADQGPEPIAVPSAVSASAPTLPSWFYLTPTTYDANEVLTACAPGFHPASLWEIRNATNLRYDTPRGYVGADQGHGPPSSVTGWIRTGYWDEYKDPGAGAANCLNWTSTSGSDYGTMAYLSSNWGFTATTISPWEAISVQCSATWTRVWCVRHPGQVYLPLTLRDW